MNTFLHFKKNIFLLLFILFTSFSFAQTGCWKQRVSGGYHTIGIKNNGTLFGWGNNDAGQMGIGNTSAGGILPPYLPTQIWSDNNWKLAAAGQHNSYAIKYDGTLWAWGDNQYGQLGKGNFNSTIQNYTPKKVGTNNDWKYVSAGYFHVIAIKNNGTLWAWGRNNNGQLGDGTTTNRNVPIQIGTDNDWVSVKGGGLHSLALKSNGSLWAWGSNNVGQLGEISFNTYIPFQVGIDYDWKQITCGDYHSGAVKQNGTLWMWGYNNSGQLGTGTITNEDFPVQIGTDNDWKDVSAGYGFTNAIKLNGTIWCFGDNLNGAFINNPNNPILTPIMSNNSSENNNIISGYNNSIIIKNDGTISTLGINQFGQLGNGTATWTPNYIPIQVSCPISSNTNVSFTPTLFLSNTSTQLGQSITISGNNYTPNGEVLLNFYGAGGLYKITANADGFGNVTHLYTNPSGAITGQVAVKVYDKTTTKYSPTKTFNLTSTISGAFNLAVTSPNNGYKIPVAQLANITWRDKMIPSYNGITYPVQSGTAKCQYDYSIEYRENSSSPWLPINGTSQVTGYATLNENVNFQTTATFSTTSTNYTIRVKDNLNNAIIAQSAIFEVTPTASVSLEWDKSMITNPSHKPIGVVADGVSRIYIKVSPTTGTLSSVDVTLNNGSATINNTSPSVTITGNDEVVVTSKTKVDVNSANEVSVTGTAKATLSSSAMTSVEGTIIKLN